MSNQEGINLLKKGLKDLKKRVKIINSNFPYALLEAIMQRANEYLENRVGFYKDTANIKDKWKIISNEDGSWILRNDSEEGAYVEFGTGIKGENSHTQSSEVGYKYDVSNHGKQGWTWYDKFNDQYIRGFTGYSGKSFLYDAYYDYVFKGEWVNILEQM